MSTRSLLLGAALFLAAACQSPRPAQPSSQQGAKLDPNLVVAKVGGKPITAAELDGKIQRELKSLEQQYQERLHDLRKNALDGMIRDQLVEAKAKEKGLTATELVEREVVQKLPQPSEEEIRSLYERAKAGGQQLPPLDDVRADIAKFINQQKGQTALNDYYETLKREADVQMLLPAYVPPKVEVEAVGPSKGAASAPVTIVEFSDYQCPFCARVEPTIDQLMKNYEGKVRLFFRDYPLPNHSQAPKAAEAAHCADDQGKYWEMHRKLFANQQALGPADLKKHAREVGLDGAKFDQCLDSGMKRQIVQKNMEAGNDAGVSGTPAFFINGRLLSGAQPYEAFAQAVDAELAAKKK